MTGTAVDTSPWRLCDSASSVLQAAPEDWLSSFDFIDLPLSSSTPEADHLAQILDFDTFDLLLPQIENMPPLNLYEVLPPVLEPDADGDREESDSFSSILEFNGCTYNQISSKATPLAVSEDLDIGAHEATDAESLPPKSHSSTMSSSHDSDAGSSLAVRATSGKRHHEDTGSGLDGGDKAGRSRPDPVDKRQQRLLRNRELAFESRQRKKSYVNDLEAKCRVLEQERNQLQQQLCFTSAENAVLKKELSQVKNKKGKDGVAEPAVFKDSLPLEFLLLLICLLLTAQLSLCVSPSLALVLRTTLLLQSATKIGGLVEEQVVVSERCFIFIVNSVKWLLDCLWYHMPLLFHGCSESILMWQAPSLLMEQSSCNRLKV